MTETFTTIWKNKENDILLALANAFKHHAIDNTGSMTSARQATPTAKRLLQLAEKFLLQPVGNSSTPELEEEMANETLALVKEGLSYQSAGAMIGAIASQDWLTTLSAAEQTAVFQKLFTFQARFLQKMAESRELLVLENQEQSQEAIRQALHSQLLEQQKIWHKFERQNQRLNEVLTLNAQLAKTDNEDDLLETAVGGLCSAFSLANVSLFIWQEDNAAWQLRVTTADHLEDKQNPPEEWLDWLNKARQSDDGSFILAGDQSKNNGQTAVTAVYCLTSGPQLFGGLLVNANMEQGPLIDEDLIFVRTFAQGLAGLWGSIRLFQETTRRTRELEILQGQFVDNLWQDPSAKLVASVENKSIHIERNPKQPPKPKSGKRQPLTIGPKAFGELVLPKTEHLPPTAEEFIQGLVREMGSALNNAQLLQTTRAISNQLELAIQVSQAATTILDQELLVKEVTELIRERFNLYYAGLFLVDETRKMAVLKAGTGEAGAIQLAKKHALPIGGGSMIGTAVASGHPIVEQDVRKAKNFAFNPILPNTRSELALPLRSRGRVIGAITAQSEQIGAFNTDTVKVLQSLADQLAIAIENADLFTQTQGTLAVTSNLFQISRRMSEARSEDEIYQALTEFARLHGKVEAAHLLVPNKKDPRLVTCVASWQAAQQVDISSLLAQNIPVVMLPFRSKLEANETVSVAAELEELMDWAFFRQAAVHAKADRLYLIPMINEQEWMGTLLLYAKADKVKGENDLQAFRTLIGQAAILLTNQKLSQQTDTLYRIGRLLSEALTREDALDLAVNEVASYLGVPQCRMVLYDSTKGYGTVVAEFSSSPHDRDAHIPMEGDFVYDRLLVSREPFILQVDSPDVPVDVLDTHLFQFDAQASLIVPSASQQDLLGYLAIDSLTGLRSFTSSNIIFAQTVVDHLTTQIENIKLLDEALNRAQELITLNQVQSNISGLLDIRQLANTIHNQLGRLLDNTSFIMARFDSETAVYSPVLVVNEGRPFSMDPRILSPNDPVYQFLQNRVPLRIDSHHPLTTCKELAFKQKIHLSGLWVPIMQEETAVGLLGLLSYEPGAYSENDIQLLRSIANHTGLALANIDLFTKIQDNMQEIQAANEKLRQLDNLKTQFLANMSHELRTPLNSIIGFSKVILKGIDGPTTPEMEEDLTSIHENGQHLLRLINSILEMAKIEAGKMTITFDKVNIEKEASIAVSTTRSLVQEKVRLITEIAPNLPIIEADPVRIRQILMNLISNAAKFTEAGYILVRIVSPSPEKIHIMVEDTGIGIAPEDYDKLFAPFEQVDTSNTRTSSGTGLGLPITQWLVKMHHGRIWFESKVGIGTKFHVILPVVQPAEDAEGIEDLEPGKTEPTSESTN
ncbi:MAG: hypothetical protein Kow0080_29100 [Candidatus Promineifilaceae bacterium]